MGNRLQGHGHPAGRSSPPRRRALRQGHHDRGGRRRLPGVDVAIGDGLTDVNEAAARSGLVARDALQAAGLGLYGTLDAIPTSARRAADFRIHAGRRGEPLLPGVTDPEFGDDQESLRLDNVRRDDDHTGEDVLVAAGGPGAERVRGFLSNTDLFHVMVAAFGWEEASAR